MLSFPGNGQSKGSGEGKRDVQRARCGETTRKVLCYIFATFASFSGFDFFFFSSLGSGHKGGAKVLKGEKQAAVFHGLGWLDHLDVLAKVASR